MNWYKSESTIRPLEFEQGESTTYLRKDIVLEKRTGEDGQTQRIFTYLEACITNEEAALFKAQMSPVTTPLRADTDFCLALLGADTMERNISANGYSERVERYKEYFQSGQWSLERINLLFERGLITEDEYKYIVGENKKKKATKKKGAKNGK